MTDGSHIIVRHDFVEEPVMLLLCFMGAADGVDKFAIAQERLKRMTPQQRAKYKEKQEKLMQRRQLAKMTRKM
jgi:hypothetical protein